MSEWIERFNEGDYENLREVIRFLRYNPFEEEEVDKRKKLLRDLVSMLDESFAENFPRCRAAAEIVRSYDRCDDIDRQVRLLQRRDETREINGKQEMVAGIEVNAVALKQLLELKNKEMANISVLLKDHGLSERYAGKTAKGAGTLSAAIRDAEAVGYDAAKLNLFDIKTSESIQQVADISFQSILKQISLTESDYIEMLKQQRELIEDLQIQVLKANEGRRMILEQITKQELLKELATNMKKKGLSEEVIFGEILSMINYDDDIILAQKKDYVLEDITEAFMEKEEQRDKKIDTINKLFRRGDNRTILKTGPFDKVKESGKNIFAAPPTRKNESVDTLVKNVTKTKDNEQKEEDKKRLKKADKELPDFGKRKKDGD